MEKITGIIDHVRYANKDNGWTILDLEISKGKRETVNVVQAGLESGMLVEFIGDWTEHPKFGKQFKASKYVMVEPDNLELLEKYLAGDKMIRYVGPVIASRIIDHFKEDTLRILNEDIDRLKEIKGITENTIPLIKEDWEQGKENREIVLFLQKLGISLNLAVKIFNCYGFQTKEVVQENPYNLIGEIDGMSFKQVDLAARRLGFKEDCLERIIYGIQHTLKKASSAGHTCLPKEELLEESCAFLKIYHKKELILESLEELCKVKFFSKIEVESVEYIYLNNLYNAEIKVAELFKKFASNDVDNYIDNLDEKIKGESYLQDISLSEEQQESLKNIVKSPISILRGSAGSGKTTIVRLLVKILSDVGKKLVLAAPTGRASQRLQEVTQFDTQTIHRLLSWDPEQNTFFYNQNNKLKGDFLIIDESSMIDIKLMKNLLLAVPLDCQILFIGDPNQLPPVEGGNPFISFIKSETCRISKLTQIYRQEKESTIVSFAHDIINKKIPSIPNPLANPKLLEENKDCLFLESSQTDQKTLNYLAKVRHLLNKKKNIKEQISFNNLSGMERRGEDIVKIPKGFFEWDLKNLTLEQEESILKSISKIRKHSSLFLGKKATDLVEQLYTKVIPKYYGDVEVQILSPMKKGPLGVRNLNKIIQEKVNPARQGVKEIKFGDEKVLRNGDKIIQLKNNYNLNIYNGDIGYIEEIDSVLNKITIYFPTEDKYATLEKEDLKNIDLAYAITIHKSQGSEFDTVIIPFSTSHYMMLYNNLLYTAITRGKKSVFFVGAKKALALATLNKNISRRYSNLEYFLKV